MNDRSLIEAITMPACQGPIPQGVRFIPAAEVRWTIRRALVATPRRLARESRTVREFQAWFDANRDAVLAVLPEV